MHCIKGHFFKTRDKKAPATIVKRYIAGAFYKTLINPTPSQAYMGVSPL